MNTKTNPTEVSGMLGERVTVRKVNRRIVVTNRPKRVMGPPSKPQEAVQRKFTKATQYASVQMDDPEAKALYASRVTGKLKTPFFVALADYLRAPIVEQIQTRDYAGAIGDVIKVSAFDDFMVTRVMVYIITGDGNLLEKGEATLEPGYDWTYTATVENPSLLGTTIRAIAFDRPGNEGALEVTI